VGIAIGSIMAGQLSKDKVEPGLSCICGFFIGILFLLLYLFAESLILSTICLTLMGVFGGAFLIPFDSFIQVNSPDEKRGQVIATSNFFSFVGVLLASFCLYIISEQLGFSAASGFALMGILTILATIGLCGRLSRLFFPFFVRKILKRFRTLKVLPPQPPPSSLIILQSNSWWDAILLFALFPKLIVLLPKHHYHRLSWFNHWADAIRLIPIEPEAADLKKLFEDENHPTYCLFLHKRDDSQQILDAYEPFFAEQGVPVFFAHGKKERLQRRFWRIRFTHKVITVYFKTRK
jgi:acyl-[acyl-carrier-protein]-phospholipid O-acyltransferase/long-chain-fatty-acid--[acyl-carrier-protein] ligase